MAIRTKKWLPKVGTVITAHLPNETIRATVAKHLDADTLEAVLNIQHPLAKSHNFRLNSRVVLHREPMQPMGEAWKVADE